MRRSTTILRIAAALLAIYCLSSVHIAFAEAEVMKVPVIAWEPVNGAVSYQLITMHEESGRFREWSFPVEDVCPLATTDAGEMVCGSVFKLTPGHYHYWLSATNQYGARMYSWIRSDVDLGVTLYVPAKPRPPVLFRVERKG